MLPHEELSPQCPATGKNVKVLITIVVLKYKIERAETMIKAEKLNLVNFDKLISNDSPSYSGIVAGECNGD